MPKDLLVEQDPRHVHTPPDFSEQAVKEARRHNRNLNSKRKRKPGTTSTRST